MELAPMKEDNTFALKGLNFTDIKIIKEACKLAADQGNQRAADIAGEIEKLMGDVSI